MSLSIQNRLTFGLVVMLTLFLVIQWALFSVAIKYIVEDLVEARLEHDIESLLGAVVFDDQGAPSLKAPATNTIYQTPLSGHYYQIISNEHQLRSRSLWDSQLPVVPIPLGETHTSEQAGPAKQHLLVLNRGYMKDGYRLSIQIGEDLALARKHIIRLQLYHAAFSVVFIIILLLLQRHVIRDALRPLAEVRHEMSQLANGEATKLTSDYPQEIAPLVDEINHLLGIMSKRLQRSRKAAGNLAHGLKAPLTLLLQQSDVPSLKDDQATANIIRRQSRIIRQLVERELKRARLAGGEPGRITRLHKELTPLIDTLRRIHIEKTLDIVTEIPVDASASMDRLDLLEMLGNLLDNACKFCTGKIYIKYTFCAGDVWLIEDDGPGCSEVEVTRLMQRGERHDEEKEGHGLGLSIVQDIVNDYGGAINLQSSLRLGGLQVKVFIPQLAVAGVQSDQG